MYSYITFFFQRDAIENVQRSSAFYKGAIENVYKSFAFSRSAIQNVYKSSVFKSEQSKTCTGINHPPSIYKDATQNVHTSTGHAQGSTEKYCYVEL